MKNQRECKHQDFRARVNVNRMEDSGRFIADIAITCAECDLPFEFTGPAAGIDWDRPTVSVDGTEMHAPIEPCYEPTIRTDAVFRMPPELHGRKH